MRCQRVNQLGWRCRMRALKGRTYCAIHERIMTRVSKHGVEPKGRKW